MNILASKISDWSDEYVAHYWEGRLDTISQPTGDELSENEIVGL